MEDSTVEEDLETPRYKWLNRISFLASALLASLVCIWYYQGNPPDDEATRQLRTFFFENSREVNEFFLMPYAKQKEFAAKSKHAFYATFLSASEVEKPKIKALAHNSIDYKPNQYWWNAFFLWVIFFTSFWFLGLIFEALVQLTRDNKPGAKP